MSTKANRSLVAYLPAIMFAAGPVVNGTAMYFRSVTIDRLVLLRALGMVIAATAVAASVVKLLPGSDRTKGSAFALAILFTGIYPAVAQRFHVRPYGSADVAFGLLYLTALACGLLLLARKGSGVLEATLPLLGLLAALFGLYVAWFTFSVGQRRESAAPGLNSGGPEIDLPRVSRAPDIVHVIFDGMGRLDYLERDYGIPARSLRRELTAAGLTVSDDAVANYSQTYLSIGAMLSMAFLEAPAGTGARSDRALIAAAIERSTVIRSLAARGYRFTLLSSGYEVLQDHHAAADGITGPIGFGDFESYLFRRSPFRMVPIGPLTFLSHRWRTSAIVDALDRFAPHRQPRYVLAHVLLPHPPFVFGPAGEPRTPRGLFMIADGTSFPGSSDEYRTGYREQALYVTRIIKRLLDEYSRLSPRPILIVSGDHGHGLGFDMWTPMKGFTSARMATFIGIAGPIRLSEPPCSPVNIYRVVFNSVFGTTLPILPDRSFVSPIGAPFDLREVQVAAANGRIAR